MPSEESLTLSSSSTTNWTTWLLTGWANNMADLAERVDDLICSFDSTSAETTMDALSMLVFGWMLFGLAVLCVGKFIYEKLLVPREAQQRLQQSSSSSQISSKANNHTQAQRSNLQQQQPQKSAAAGLHAIGESAVLFGGGASASNVAAALARSRSQHAAQAAQAKKSTPLVTGANVGNLQGSGVYVPPTPPNRKRLARKASAGPLMSPARSTRSLQLPCATGSDADAVRWTNEMIVWLHTDLNVLDELLQEWVNSMNDSVSSSIAEHGIGVDFVRVLPQTQPPILSNIFCECDSKDDVRITCDCESTPALQLKAFRQQGDKVETCNYRVNVNRFRARLNILCVTEKLLLDLKCDGWPDIKVNLAPVGVIKKDANETQLQEVVSEIIVGALRGTDLHLNLSGYQNCPRLWRESTNQSPYSMYGHYDASHSDVNAAANKQRSGHMRQSSAAERYAPGERRLLVKVVRASELGGDNECKEPYCVVQLDEPPQRNQTSIKKDTKNPIWDEAFLFDITHDTAEVLLEIYDRNYRNEKFLGLGVVGVEELLANPSQRQIIPLQGRPYDPDQVAGTLTVEFLFIEGAEIPQIGNKPFRVKETIRTTSSPTSRTFPQSGDNLLSGTHKNYNNDYISNGEVMDSPYRTGHSNGNKGTLIVHSQQRKADRQVVKVTLNDKGGWQEVIPEHFDKEMNLVTNKSDNGTTNSTNFESTRDRGRTRRKRRDFFGTIRKRLGRSKTRSKSVGSEGGFGHDDGHSRSISADRARDPTSATPREPHSRRSSISEASAVSGTSTKTYVNEASTLVLESLENGIRKHYLVPLSLAQKSKWKKKGTKLHIFNDHTFIAKHIQGGTICEVCKKTLARRLGKQGYECRDCQMKCHKHCHVKVDTMCSSSQIQSIELELIGIAAMKRKQSVRVC